MIWILWDDVQGQDDPWDQYYYQENSDTSEGFHPSHIVHHMTDSALTTWRMAMGHKPTACMLSQNFYAETAQPLVKNAMYCGKRLAKLLLLCLSTHATPAAFITHINNYPNNHSPLH
jgi:alkaline phosphatase